MTMRYLVDLCLGIWSDFSEGTFSCMKLTCQLKREINWWPGLYMCKIGRKCDQIFTDAIIFEHALTICDW